jgi:hypothetical protein
MTTVQIELKNVGAIHELPLHFLCHTQLKTAIVRLSYSALRCEFDTECDR